MKDSMERRRQLLEEARAIYSDQQTIPAVHPRYHAVYQELYPKEEKMRGTFAFRAFICFLLFTAFVAMDQRGNEKLPVSSDQIAAEIGADIDLPLDMNFSNLYNFLIRELKRML